MKRAAIVFALMCAAIPAGAFPIHLPLKADAKPFHLTAKVIVPEALPAAPNCGTSPHCIQFSWTAPADVQSSSTYNVYLLAGTQAQPCPASAPTTTPGGFTKVNSTGIGALTFTVPEATAGAWCGFVTQVFNGVESNPSNTASAVILPLAPAAVSIVSD